MRVQDGRGARRAAGVCAAVGLCHLLHVASADCQAIIDCHIGEDVDELKSWLNSALNCDCVRNPDCTCESAGLCSASICMDPRTVTLMRVPPLGGCDAGLATLIEAQKEACMNVACCPKCPPGMFTPSVRLCSVPYTKAETYFTSTYLAVLVIVVLLRATNTRVGLILDGYMPLPQDSPASATKGMVF